MQRINTSSPGYFDIYKDHWKIEIDRCSDYFTFPLMIIGQILVMNDETMVTFIPVLNPQKYTRRIMLVNYFQCQC